MRLPVIHSWYRTRANVCKPELSGRDVQSLGLRTQLKHKPGKFHMAAERTDTSPAQFAFVSTWVCRVYAIFCQIVCEFEEEAACIR